MPEDRPDLDAVARTDRLIDALAAGRPVTADDFDDPDDEALIRLSEGWRDALRRPGHGEVIAESEAAAAVRRGVVSRRRTHRGFTVVGSVAATLLCLGGVGAIIAGAHPGGALYGLRTTLFGESQSVHDDRVELTAKTELAKVQQMIDDGQWDQAHERLTALNDTVQTVNDAGRKKNLVDECNRLHHKVYHRDPNAAPPGSPSNPAGPPTTSVTVSIPTS
jgi:hypothetical protein